MRGEFDRQLRREAQADGVAFSETLHRRMIDRLPTKSIANRAWCVSSHARLAAAIAICVVSAAAVIGTRSIRCRGTAPAFGDHLSRPFNVALGAVDEARARIETGVSINDEFDLDGSATSVLEFVRRQMDQARALAVEPGKPT